MCLAAATTARDDQPPPSSSSQSSVCRSVGRCCWPLLRTPPRLLLRLRLRLRLLRIALTQLSKVRKILDGFTTPRAGERNLGPGRIRDGWTGAGKTGGERPGRSRSVCPSDRPSSRRAERSTHSLTQFGWGDRAQLGFQKARFVRPFIRSFVGRLVGRTSCTYFARTRTRSLSGWMDGWMDGRTGDGGQQLKLRSHELQQLVESALRVASLRFTSLRVAPLYSVRIHC